MGYKIKPKILRTIETDKLGFTYMCFPGEKIVLEVTYFIVEQGPKIILVDM